MRKNINSINTILFLQFWLSSIIIAQLHLSYPFTCKKDIGSNVLAVNVMSLLSRFAICNETAIFKFEREYLCRSFNLIVSSRQELRSFVSKVHNESRNKS